MQKYKVPNMSCGHCVRTVTDAVKALDPSAAVSADLDSRELSVQTDKHADSVADAIRAAGYENVLIAA
jgi:copper chaperone